MTTKTRIGVDTPQMEAFFALLQAQLSLSRTLDRELEEARGISMIEYFLLLNLRYSEDGQLPLGELAAEVGLTKSGATRLVDRMSSAGFVERVPDPGDRRITFAHITDAGREELRKAWPVHRRGIKEHFAAHLTEEEATTLNELLGRFGPLAP
jgi:DNA-binding MarR family transcriptional regulator